ncbi:MAG: beta-glucosidase BglX [Chloroherpetonaceae bacterium]|nr:beta-glucosidase BglX [Chloroherpetonaceae bacterium]
MKKTLVLFLMSALLFSVGFAQNAKTPAEQIANDKVIYQKIDSLLRIMTIEEKLGQLNQVNSGISDHKKGAYLSPDLEPMIREGKVGSILNIYGVDVTRKAQEYAMQSRLKIPILFGLDVIHGYRTTFPTPLAESSSWDMALLEESARIAAIEASAAGVHWTFAPMVDVARDPRWGRIIEGAGEDTYFGTLAAAARVKGFQGEDLSLNNTILACAKHFAAYGGAEGGRDYNTVDISERTLHETYLPPFKAAIDAGVLSFMASFNEIAGMPSSVNRKLMTEILREKWGYKGFVVSDWGSIGEVRNHGISKNDETLGILALNAGLDMDMESKIFIKLAGAVRSGKIKMEVLDEAVRRNLYIKFKLGLFDDPFRYCNNEREKALVLSPKHREIARKVAERSIVLLKNENNLLPLKRDTKRIAVIGSLANAKRDMLGEWEVVGRPEDAITILDGIRAKVDSKTKVVYAEGCTVSRDEKVALSDKGFNAAIQAAKNSDVVIAVMGETADMSGEAHSRSSLDLPGVQLELLKKLVETGKPIVLVLSNGRPISLNGEALKVPAVLETWQLGVEAGNAIANVLFGDYNPSGKLTVTVPRSAGQIPIFYNHKISGRPIEPKNPTDRYKSRYIDIPSDPLYPFGYGLSYTTFAYRNLKLDKKSMKENDTLKVSIEIENTGKRNGEEIVQLYINDFEASVTRPVKELKSFRKLTLSPGEKKIVDFMITRKDLEFLSASLTPIVESGKFTVMVGRNSTDVLEESFELVP